MVVEFFVDFCVWVVGMFCVEFGGLLGVVVDVWMVEDFVCVVVVCYYLYWMFGGVMCGMWCVVYL